MHIYIEEEVMLRRHEFIEKMRSGAIMIYPTDTIYGIGCNALIGKAVEKIRKIKNRNTMPFSVIAPSRQWIMENCIVTAQAEKWIRKLPGRLTLILKLKNKNAISTAVNNGWDTIGVRIPENWFTKLVEAAGVPFVTTSANISGQDYMTSIDDLDPEIKSRVDYIIYTGEKRGRPSQLVDLTAERPKITKR